MEMNELKITLAMIYYATGYNTKLSYRRGTARRAMSVELLSTAA